MEGRGMIDVHDGVFRLATRGTSYWFRVSAHGHLEHLHYGVRIPPDQSVEALALKRTAEIGVSVAYDEADPLYCLDNMCLEWSGIGMGDYREPPLEIGTAAGLEAAGDPDFVRMTTTWSSDFVYVSHQIRAGVMESGELPGPHSDDAETLTIDMADSAARLGLRLEYTVFEDVDVISRRATLTNLGDHPATLRKISSLMIDLPNRDYRALTLNGAWIKEAHLKDQRLSYGIFVNSSTTGTSSNRHNPGFLLAENRATESYGRVYGFNLIYSGNHRSAIEVSPHDLVRVNMGINPQQFEWVLSPGQSFETPQAVMTFSARGIGQASRNFHDFINAHIVPTQWRNRPRPVVYNNWEATFFDFTSRKLTHLARQAKNLGMEVFVLDDGWFGKRNSDSAGLGDYTVNRRKFPSGLGAFADDIRDIGLGFGIWVEPEMVNEDSDLYRAHPNWAVTTPGRRPAMGRHQLLLDLTREDVRDYIVENVGRIIEVTKAVYVKWDFNRPCSDAFSADLPNQGEFSHRYVLGLYDVLRRIFGSRPDILLESCASGGNRFDLGMLCFSPQIWASDDTDPIERLAIQQGYSYLYPPSTMGAHVSGAPHQQTLRNTPLTTRFNVAAFGCLGYELDLDLLSHVERTEIREQIEFYRRHRSTLQYGHHYRGDRDAGAKANKTQWTMVALDGSEALTLLAQTLAVASEGFDRLSVDGLDPDALYHVQTRPQSIFIGRFGSLVKHILPMSLNPDGVVLGVARRLYRLTDCVEEYEAYGTTLADGIMLNNQFMGTAYTVSTRLLGDFGSAIYVMSRHTNARKASLASRASALEQIN